MTFTSLLNEWYDLKQKLSSCQAAKDTIEKMALWDQLQLVERTMNHFLEHVHDN